MQGRSGWTALSFDTPFWSDRNVPLASEAGSDALVTPAPPRRPPANIVIAAVVGLVAGWVAAGAAGFTVDRQDDLRRRRYGAEITAQLGFAGAVRQVADEQTDSQSTLLEN